MPCQALGAGRGHRPSLLSSRCVVSDLSFSLCHSPLSPLPVSKSEFFLNPHGELT